MLQKSSSSSGGGSGSYVFVSYSHRDAKRVKREIDRLERAGIVVWYDDAIRPGHRWRAELAHAIERCSAFILFTSRHAAESANCQQELAFAAEQSRPLLQVQLEETELPTEFRFTLAAHQAIRAWDTPDYQDRLVETLANMLELDAAPAETIGTGRFRFLRPRLILSLAAAGLVLAIAILGSTTLSDRGADRPFVADERSIAVMRFITIGEDTALGDGLCEHLLHLLMKLQEISVPSRTSSWTATDQSLRPTEIAQRLEVRYVLEGSVQKIEENIRVTAQLIDGYTGHHVWSDSYTDTLTARNFFQVQDNIARQLVSHLDATLSDQSNAVLEHLPTQSDQALAAYLRGRELRRGPSTRENIAAAEKEFELALAHDPQFAEAHAAFCEAGLAAYSVERSESHFARAKEHCREAKLHSRDELMTMLALATLYRHEGRLADAEVEISRALQLQPHNTAVLEEQGRLLRTMGRFEEAEAIFESAIRAEPGNWSVYKSLGNFLVRTGRADEAVGLYLQALRLDPDNPVASSNLAATFHRLGEFEAAGQIWEEVSSKSPNFLGHLNSANAFFYAGDYERAIQSYDSAIALVGDDYRAYGGRAASIEHHAGIDQAIPDYQRAADLATRTIEINRQDSEALARLAFYRAKLGESALSREYLRQLTALPGKDADTQFMIALVYITLGERETARQALAAALDAGFSRVLLEADPLIEQSLQDSVLRLTPS